MLLSLLLACFTQFVETHCIRARRALILGSGTNSKGRSSSLSAPSGPALQDSTLLMGDLSRCQAQENEQSERGVLEIPAAMVLDSQG